MSKYIGFEIDSKKIMACVVESGKNVYQTLRHSLLKKQLDTKYNSKMEISIVIPVFEESNKTK